ncbi:MAG TPA: carboxypeptidase-like regulatory domain-containing protein, partial [Mycobacterium sp.]
MSDYHPLRIRVRVTHSGRLNPVENAYVRVIAENNPDVQFEAYTDAAGRFELQAPHTDGQDGHYLIVCQAFGRRVEERIHAEGGRTEIEVPLDLPLGMQISAFTRAADDRLVPAGSVAVGRPMVLRAETAIDNDQIANYDWLERSEARLTHRGGREAELVFSRPGTTTITATITERGGAGARARSSVELLVSDPEVRTVGGHVRVTMERTDSVPTLDEALWAAIGECTEAIGFERYHHYIRRVFGLDDRGLVPNEFSRRLVDLGARGVGSYRTLRDLTELFLVSRCGPAAIGDRFDNDPLLAFANPERRRAPEEIDERLREYLHQGEFPYIERVVNAAYPWLDREGRGFEQLIRRMFRQPLLIELWHAMCLEHGMLMRTMDAVCDRFQNNLKPGENDTLAGYELT